MPGPDDLVNAATRRGIRDARVLDALGRVLREQFVPPESTATAYLDEPVRLPHAQVTTQPSLCAQMLAALHLTGTERVLEIGTGYAYQAALLAHLAAQVWTVERFDDFAAAARRNLHTAGLDGVEVVVGDGTSGLPAKAPFDAVIVSAAFPEVPPPLAEQLSPGGRLVQPLGPGGDESVVVFRKAGQRLVRERVVTGARFVRLTGRHGHPR